MSPTSTNTPVARSRLTKNRRRSGVLKSGQTSLTTSCNAASSVASSAAEVSQSFPNMLPPTLPKKEEISDMSGSPSYYRDYETFTSSPFHIPNSQAPIPGKEVYWDYDTPQSRRCREALQKEFEESDSPISKLDVTPKMRMFAARGRGESLASKEIAIKGEEALQDLLNMCKEAEEAEEKLEKVQSVEKKNIVKDMEEEVALTLKEEVKEEVRENIKEEVDMFGDDFDFGDSMNFGNESLFMEDDPEANVKNEALDKVRKDEVLDTAIADDDMFDDDDESFLLQATQAAEVNFQVESKSHGEKVLQPSTSSDKQAAVGLSEPIKKEQKTLQKEPVKPKVEVMVTHPAISRVKTDVDGFGCEDDSFDEIMSQMVIEPEVIDGPASPVLRKKRKCFNLEPTQSQHVLQTTLPQPLVTAGKQLVQPVALAPSRVGGGSIKKFSSFDSQEEKKTIARFKSDSNIGMASNSTVQFSFKAEKPKPVDNYPITKPVDNYPITKPVNNYPIIKPVNTYPVAKPVDNLMNRKPMGQFVNRKPVQQTVKSEPVGQLGTIDNRNKIMSSMNKNIEVKSVSIGSGKPVTRSCTKEEIDRKRKEAVAKRQQSLSQLRK